MIRKVDTGFPTRLCSRGKTRAWSFQFEAIALYSAIGSISERRDEKSPAPVVDALIFDTW